MDSQDAVRNYSVCQLQTMLNEKEISSVELTRAYLHAIEENKNAYLYVNDEKALKQANAVDKKRTKGEAILPLGGIPIAIKDNIAVKDMPLTCGSKLLRSHIAAYSATVVNKIGDCIVLGKTNMDEFAMGSDGKNSAFGAVFQPNHTDYVAGGSSSGSAAAVAAKTAPFALGSDTGGSVRLPAAFCGIVGFKPSYGRVSRYGLTAFASSLEQIGPMANSVGDCRELYRAIKGYDEKDVTTQNFADSMYSTENIKIGLVKEYVDAIVDEEIKDCIVEFIKIAEQMGIVVEECSLKSASLSVQAYYLLSSAEAASNLARFDGLRYGEMGNGVNYKEMFAQTRSDNFGYEVKKRILLGNYILREGYYEQYYRQALGIQDKIRMEFKELFKTYHCLLTPTTVVAGVKADEQKNALELYQQDICTVGVNIAKLPALTLPFGKNKDGLPIGLQLIGSYGDDERIFAIGEIMEEYRGRI